MKNFKKVMAMAISVAAVCTSVSAFAELEYSYTDDLAGIATYDATDHTLTITAANAVDDKTVLVLDNGVVDTEAEGDDILYINQYAAGETAYTEMGLKGTALAVGTYAVKVGYTDENGDFAILDGTIVVAEKQNEGTVITVYYGDVTADGAANDQDAAAIMSKAIGGPAKVNDDAYTIGEKLDTIYYGDVTADGAANDQDAAAIMSKAIGGPAKVNDAALTIGSKVTLTIK